MRIGILEPNRFNSNVIVRLSEFGVITEYAGDDLISFLKPLDALFIRLGYYIDSDFLQHAPNLKYLCSPTTGHAHLDESALLDRNIEIISLRGKRDFLDTIRATPEHTFGLVLSLLRCYKSAFTKADSGRWNRDAFWGEELCGKTVGIIGLGRVGYRVASYCSAFDANVIFYDINDVKADNSWRRFSDIQSVILKSEIVILSASYQNGAPPIVGEPEINALAGRYFINTARGELVDEVALLRAIRKNKLAGVATDVISNETGDNYLEEWYKLHLDRNVIVTPHIGGATLDSIAKTERFIADLFEERLKAVRPA